MFLKDTNRLKAKDQKQCALLSLVKRKPRAAQTLTKVDLRAKNITKNSHAVTLNESPENTLLNVYLLVTDPNIYWELTEYKENLDKHGIGDKPVTPALGGSKAETLGVQGHPRAAWEIKSHPSWDLDSKNKNNTKDRQINCFQRLIPLFREWQKRQAESQQGHRQHFWPAYPEHPGASGHTWSTDKEQISVNSIEFMQYKICSLAMMELKVRTSNRKHFRKSLIVRNWNSPF